MMATPLLADRTASVITKLSTTLGVPPTKLWAALVGQVYVDAGQYALYLIGWMTLAGTLVWVFRRLIPRLRDKDDRIIFRTIICVVVTVLCFVTLGLLGSIFGRLGNPDYYALQYVLDLGK